MRNFKILFLIVILIMGSCAHYQRVYDQELFFMDNTGRSNSGFIAQLQEALTDRIFSEIRYVLENDLGETRIMVVYGFEIRPPENTKIKSAIVQIIGK